MTDHTQPSIPQEVDAGPSLPAMPFTSAALGSTPFIFVIKSESSLLLSSSPTTSPQSPSSSSKESYKLALPSSFTVLETKAAIHLRECALLERDRPSLAAALRKEELNLVWKVASGREGWKLIGEDGANWRDLARSHGMEPSKMLEIKLVVTYKPPRPTKTSETTAPAEPTPAPAQPPTFPLPQQPMMLNPAHSTLLQLLHYHQHLLTTLLLPLLPEGTEFTPHGWEESGAAIGWEEAGRMVKEEMERLGITVPPTEEEGGKARWRLKKEPEFRAVVDVGGHVQELVIPDPSLLTFRQHVDLDEYRATSAMVAHLQSLLHSIPFQIPVPANLLNNHPAAPAAPPLDPNVLQIRLPFRPNRILLEPTVWLPCVLSLIKVQFTMYMFSHGLFVYSIKDKVFVGMLCLSLGWWMWDCWAIVRAEERRRMREREQEEALRRVREEREGRNGAGAGPAGVPGANGALPPLGDAAAAGMRPVPTPTAAAGPPRPILERLNLLNMADIGLSHDRRLLRLFYFSPSARARQPDLTVPDHLIPSSDVNLPIAPREPSVLWRHLVLPLYLFVSSFLPAWDLRRRGLIRERERHMRLLVEKLTRGKREERARALLAQAAAEDAGNASSDTGQDGTIQQDVADVAAPVVAEAQAQEAQETPVNEVQEKVYPGNLSVKAKNYYLRVLSRGEQIDWDEEREAQAALMGGQQQDAGERLDMF